MEEFLFIVYVSNQEKSKEFYQKLFQIAPNIDVPGMTDFKLTKSVTFGIMPENGIAKIINNRLPHPNKGNGIPRCEIYLRVANPNEYISRGIGMGGKLVSELSDRNWGDKAGYISDLDGHIIAFAEKK